MIRKIARLDLRGIALLIMLGLISLPAQATNYWKNSVLTGNWSTGSNWSAIGVGGVDNDGAPTLGEAVNIAPNVENTYVVTYDVSAPALGLLSIDRVGPGATTTTLSMPSNNSLTANGIFVGGYSGAGVTSGRGALNQSAGTVTTSPGTGDLVLGFGAGSNGFYTLSGGALVTGQNQYVGFLGAGTFTHTAGSNTINASAAGFFSLGRNAGSTGTYNLSGTGALVANTSEYIGHGGTGVFNQTGGTNTISGAGNSLYLGFGASGPGGAYNLSDGTLTAPAVFVGYAGAGPSNFLITGAGSRVNATNLFVVGRAGGGTLTLANGGTLAIGNGTGPLQISTVAGNSGNVRIGNGGAAGVLHASAVQFGQPGELEFNHTGNLTFATPISGPGSVFKFGLGTTTLSGTNSYRGISYVNGGTLAISSDGNLGEAPGSFNSQHFQFDGGTLRATQSFTMAATRGIEFSANGGTIEVDATKTLTYPNNLQLAIGKMNKTGTGALSIGDITVGANPPFGPFQPAELLVTGGGILSTGFFHLGDDNETGTATISGPGTTVTNTYAWVGFSGAGYLNIIDGGTMNTAVDGHVARQFGPGIATVRGAGSTWTLGNDLHVIWAVDGAIGVLNIEDQALVYVGNTLNNDGATINLSGGTLRFNNYLEVNDGAFNFNSGTIQLAGSRSVGTDAAIANFFGDTPIIPTGKGLTVEGTGTLSTTLTIDGGTFKANSLVTGAGGALNFDRGVLELTGGAITGLASLVVPPNGEFRASGVQAFRITGVAGSTITATGNLTLGNAAAVNGFGTQGTLQVGANTVTLLDANDVVFDSLALATLGSGGSPGAITAANGLTLDFGGNFTGFGTVSTPNNIAKPLINNGHITGDSVAQPITLSGYVKGVGTFDNVSYTGTFSPGLSPTSLIVGNVAFSPTSTLIMEIGGTTPRSGYDQILSSGALAFDGTLLVTLINFSPAADQSFNLFDWASTSGTFAALQLPALAGALVWNTSQLYTTGVLSVVSPGVPGDYNNNGSVDAADYVLWRKGGPLMNEVDTPGTVNAADYAAWRARFGNPGSGSGTGASANATVPEPATWVMLIVAAVGMRLRLRHIPTECRKLNSA